MTHDPYTVIGVSRSATQEDIKRAFHKLAHQHHPDKAGGNAEKFKECSEAYAYLQKNHKPQTDPANVYSWGPAGHHTAGRTTTRNPRSNMDFGQAWEDLQKKAKQAGAGAVFDDFMDAIHRHTEYNARAQYYYNDPNNQA